MWVVLYVDAGLGVKKCIGPITDEREAERIAYGININAFLRQEEETAEVIELDPPSE